MYETILFPTDGSDGADAALDHALAVAAAHDATVHVLNVADTTRDSVTQIRGEVVDALEQEGEAAVGAVADRASERGISTVTEVLQGDPSATIVDYAAEREVDLVVMPTRGRTGLERLLLGSTTERVVRQSSVPVLTIRPDDDVRVTYPYGDVLVPTDGSDCAGAALEVGIDVVEGTGAALHLLSVVDVTSLGVDVRTELQVESLEASAEEILGEAATRASGRGVESVTETVGFAPSIHREVLEYVDAHGIDLLVVGTHGRTGLDRYMLGSVTEKLVRKAPVPVLTVRKSQPDDGE